MATSPFGSSFSACLMRCDTCSKVTVGRLRLTATGSAFHRPVFLRMFCDILSWSRQSAPWLHARRSTSCGAASRSDRQCPLPPCGAPLMAHLSPLLCQVLPLTVWCHVRGPSLPSESPAPAPSIGGPRKQLLLSMSGPPPRQTCTPVLWGCLLQRFRCLIEYAARAASIFVHACLH